MIKIIDKNNRSYLVLKDSIQINCFDIICDVNKINNETLINGIDFDEMDNMGGSSQVKCYLSQHREGTDNDVVNDITPRNTYYKEALPLFEQMINSFPNKHLFDEMCQFMINRHMVHIVSRGINNQICNSKRMTFLVKITPTKDRCRDTNVYLKDEQFIINV